ncbi:MAG: hypothetical protein ACFB0E_22040, partial [Leptolyngbyaceae cyanobacterium]
SYPNESIAKVRMQNAEGKRQKSKVRRQKYCCVRVLANRDDRSQIRFAIVPATSFGIQQRCSLLSVISYQIFNTAKFAHISLPAVEPDKGVSSIKVRALWNKHEPACPTWYELEAETLLSKY